MQGLLVLQFLQRNQLKYKILYIFHIFILQPQIAVLMDKQNPIIYRLVANDNYVKIKEIPLSEILFFKNDLETLYQLTFELSTQPNRSWKALLLDSWPFFTEHLNKTSKTIIWAYDNRIIVDNIPIELDKKVIKDLVSEAIEKVNKWIELRAKQLT